MHGAQERGDQTEPEPAHQQHAQPDDARRQPACGLMARVLRVQIRALFAGLNGIAAMEERQEYRAANGIGVSHARWWREAGATAPPLSSESVQITPHVGSKAWSIIRRAQRCNAGSSSTLEKNASIAQQRARKGRRM